MSRSTARAELVKDVALMRTLGIARWGEIYLGPDPKLEHPHEAARRAPTEVLADEMARRHRTLFAASSISPPLPKRDTSKDDVPRAVVTRNSAEAARGRTRTPSEGESSR